jgi:hypothetical protein
MDTENILEQYGLTQEITAHYIDAITRMNQTQTAENSMSAATRLTATKTPSKKWTHKNAPLISNLTQDKLLHQATE